MNQAERNLYVAVEGVIGVGKTTLVHRLARRLGGRVVLEEFEENPFLADFYRDQAAFAFRTQIFFLMSRFRQQEILAQGDLFRRTTISDYIFDKDQIFAVSTLAADELSLYRNLFDVLRPRVPVPDVVVYLRADHAEIMRRIEARGRSYEAGMNPVYIRELAEAYGRFFTEFEGCPVVQVDTTGVDLRRDNDAVEAVLAAVHAKHPPRQLVLGAKNATPELPGLI